MRWFRACSRPCARPASGSATVSPPCCRTGRMRWRWCWRSTSIGAIWSSCSPDFGERGVLDRFGQIEPKVFVTVDGYWYNGKPIRLLDKLKPIVDHLPTAKAVVIVDYLGEAEAVAKALPRGTTLTALPAAVHRQAGHLRAAAVRPPGLHPVLVGHDRRAEMHRARRRRHAAPAPQGAPPAMRPAAGRAAVLLHHAGLDDVELADLRPRDRRDA